MDTHKEAPEKAASFTGAAKYYMTRSPMRVVLIDSEALAHLMIRHEIGVQTCVRHKIKRTDEDCFDQEML